MILINHPFPGENFAPKICFQHIEDEANFTKKEILGNISEGVEKLG